MGFRLTVMTFFGTKGDILFNIVLKTADCAWLVLKINATLLTSALEPLA